MTDTTMRGPRHPEALGTNRKASAIHATATESPMEIDPPTAAMTITREVPVVPMEGSEHLLLEHLGATIGTVVHGLDMVDATDADIAATKQLLLDRKVVFLRDQYCTEQQHIDFAARFGPLEIHPFNPMHPEYDEIIPITAGPKSVGSTNTWHSDVMWRMEPSLGSLLRARQLPTPMGGDTLFSDMYAAYNGLPDDIKEQVDGLMALNSGGANGSKATARKRLAAKGATEAELLAFDEEHADVPLPVHPVIRTHPETGRKAIYVNRAFTTRIIGLEEAESTALLDRLYRQADTPEYQCRFNWEVGSVAFWDNRSVQHYGSSDYWPQRRRMERVTIAGDLPYCRTESGETITSYAWSDADS